MEKIYQQIRLNTELFKFVQGFINKGDSADVLRTIRFDVDKETNTFTMTATDRKRIVHVQHHITTDCFVEESGNYELVFTEKNSSRKIKTSLYTFSVEQDPVNEHGLGQFPKWKRVYEPVAELAKTNGINGQLYESGDAFVLQTDVQFAIDLSYMPKIPYGYLKLNIPKEQNRGVFFEWEHEGYFEANVTGIVMPVIYRDLSKMAFGTDYCKAKQVITRAR